MSTADDKIADISATAGLLAFHIGAWNEFGYANPPTPDCTPIPPLGERSANAITAGHDAIADIDQMLRNLHALRSQLVTELRTNEDELGRRVDATLAARRPGESGVPA